MKKKKQQFKEKNKSWRIYREKKRGKANNVIKNIKGKYIKKGEKSISEKKIEGIIFIQHTEYSELAKVIRKRLQDLEKIGKLKIKIVERTGDKIVDILHKSNE